MIILSWLFYLNLLSSQASALTCSQAHADMQTQCVSSREADLNGNIKSFQDQLTGRLGVVETKNLLVKMLTMFDVFIAGCGEKTQSCLNACNTEIASGNSNNGVAELESFKNSCKQIEDTKIAQTVGAKVQLQQTLQKLDSTVQMIVIDVNTGNNNTNVNNVVNLPAGENKSVGPGVLEEVQREVFRNIASLQLIYGSDRIGVGQADLFSMVSNAYRNLFGGEQ